MKEIDYTVARHTFRLQMESGSPLWEDLTAYAPFEAKATDGNGKAPDEKGCIFTLTVCEELTADDIIPVLIPCDPPEESARLDVFRTAGGGYLFEFYLPFSGEKNCRLRVSSDFACAEAVLYGSHLHQLIGLNSVLMLLFALSTAGTDTVHTHASAVMLDDKAYLFLGRSGTGKSTHSRLWQHYIRGVEPLNDDHPILRIDETGEVIAYGSPWSGKTPCYRNASAPVGGIVRLCQAKENRIKRLSTLEAYASLTPSCSCMKWESEMANDVHATIEQIITTVPCYRLECLPDAAAARLCHSTVAAPKQETETGNPRRKESLCNE